VSRRSFAVLLVVSVVSLMTLAGLALAVGSAGGSNGSIWGEALGLVEVDGVIVDDAALIDQIRTYREDRSVRGLLVAINSPGGVVAPSQSIYSELRRAREDGVPVVATIGSVGASGGYYVALAADTIFALPGSITGSIGVVMELPEASELMDRVGVRVEVVKSAEHKDTGSPFRPVTAEDRAVLQSMVSDVYEQFVDVVAEERGLSAESVRLVADGRIFSGRQALQHGLVDRMGNWTDAVATAGRMAGLGETPRVLRPRDQKLTVLDLLLGRSMSKALVRFADQLQVAVGPSLKYVVP
jgi:protease-4